MKMHYLQQSMDKGSFLLSPQPNIRKTNEVERYGADVLEASVNKSYIYKMAEKGEKKNKKEKMDLIIEEQQRTGMLRSRIPGNSLILSRKVEQKKQTEDASYELNFSNEGKPKQNSFNCCNISDKKQKAIVKLSAYKELCVQSAKNGETLFCFNFNTLKGEIIQDRQIPQQIMLKINENIMLKFEQFEGKVQFSKFKRNLKQSVENGFGNEFEMLDLLQKPGFEKMRYKPVVEFAEHCQTGDILLFQGSHFFANVQRALTNSDYDHVGMVIRDPVYGILIFQSNSTSGVCLTPWQLLIKYKWYKYIERIVWRKLQNLQRDAEFNEEVHNFVMANLGKQYYISFDKILSKKSYIAGKSEQVGFFCSELVATLYKDLKLLTRNQKDPNFKPSCNFYPYHFTQKFKLNLCDGELSPEYIIHFDQNQINDYYHF